MVRGIYQTSEADGRQSGVVAAGIAIVIVILCIAGLFKVINEVGGSICYMDYYTQDMDTYKGHAEVALQKAGYAWESLKDMGNYPEGTDDANPKIRRFMVKGLVRKGMYHIGPATVYVKFDSWNQTRAVTTVYSVERSKT